MPVQNLPSPRYALYLASSAEQRTPDDMQPMVNQTRKQGGIQLTPVAVRPGRMAQLKRIVTGRERKMKHELKSAYRGFVGDMHSEFGGAITGQAITASGLDKTHRLSSKDGGLALRTCQHLSAQHSRPLLDELDTHLGHAAGAALTQALAAAGLDSTRYDASTMTQLLGIVSDLAHRRTVFAVHQAPNPEHPGVSVQDIHRQACADVAAVCTLLAPADAAPFASHVLISVAGAAATPFKFPPTPQQVRETAQDKLAELQGGGNQLSAHQMRQLNQRLQHEQDFAQRQWDRDQDKREALKEKQKQGEGASSVQD